VGSGRSCPVPCCRGLLSCGVAEQGSVVGRNGLKAEGPNTYEERAPRVANVEIFGVVEKEG
jgi:hypothetical protein